MAEIPVSEVAVVRIGAGADNRARSRSLWAAAGRIRSARTCGGAGMPRRDAGGRMLMRARKAGRTAPAGRPGRLPVPARHARPSGTLTPLRYQIPGRIRASGSLWCTPDPTALPAARKLPGTDVGRVGALPSTGRQIQAPEWSAKMVMWSSARAYRRALSEFQGVRVGGATWIAPASVRRCAVVAAGCSPGCCSPTSEIWPLGGWRVAPRWVRSLLRRAEGYPLAGSRAGSLDRFGRA